MCRGKSSALRRLTLSRHPRPRGHERRRIAAIEAKVHAEFLTSDVFKLQKAQVLAREAVATQLGVDRNVVIDFEHRCDLYSAALGYQVQALGGKMKFGVRFGGAESSKIEALGHVSFPVA